MRTEKGQPGYVKARKQKYLLGAVVEFAIVIAIFITGYIQTRSRLNLLTVVAVVGCLPAAKMLVEFITMAPYKSIEEAKEHKAIVVGVPVKDTIKVIDNDKNIVDTPNRSVLWAVQTPQTFDYNILIDAYKDAFKNKFYGTDDAMLVERIGYKVKMLEGSYNNIKITTQEDLNIGSQILRVQD